VAHRAMNLQVGSYKGRPVLTWWQGAVWEAHGQGEYVIADTSYSEVARVQGGNGYIGDLHKFFLTPQGRAGFHALRRGLPTTGRATTAARHLAQGAQAAGRSGGGQVTGPTGRAPVGVEPASRSSPLHVQAEDQVAEDGRVVTRWLATVTEPGSEPEGWAPRCVPGCAGISIIRLLAGKQVDSRTEFTHFTCG
jgi:hypothetical protein